MGMMGGRNWADILSLVGAGLKDASPDSPGGNLAAAQALMTQRAQLQRKQQFTQQLGGMLQPAQAPMRQAQESDDPETQAFLTGNAPQTGGGGLNMNDPRMAALVMQAKEAGYDMAPILDVLKAQQPDIRYDRGQGYDGKTGKGAGAYHPDFEKGQEPLYDRQGNVVAVRNISGAVQAAGEMAGGIAGAQEKAKAPYNFQTLEGPDGGKSVISTETAARLGSRGGLIAAGQSPAAASAAKITADAKAQAAIDLPATLQTAQTALSLIEQMKTSPALKMRTGLMGKIPTIPGSPGADFDAKAAQLKGKVFMEAFNSLKGAGQITEIEGKSAQDSIARLDRAQSPEAYTQALNDLQSVIRVGMARAAAKAGGPKATPAARPTSAAPGRSAIEAEMKRRGLM